MQILTHQPQVSLLKKKGPGSKGEFSKMHLAVYPFQVEFLSNIEYKTLFLFQKNFQIIGETHQLIPVGKKGSKYQLKNSMNIIYFKLFSPTNVVYKWSVYRKYTNGQEEYLQSCTLNLKEVVNNFIIPQKSVGLHSNTSLIQLGFNAKQMRLKFPKTGLILMFMLFVSEDTHQIKDYVDGIMLRKYEDNLLEMIPPLGMLKYDSNMGLSSRKNQNSAYSLQDLQRKKNSKKISNQSFPSDLKSKQNIKRLSQDKKNSSDSIDHISNLIMSFDPNIAENVQLKQDSNENKLLQFQRQAKQQKTDQIIEQQNKQNENGKKNQVRDFGMLKLQSDQGRINQEQIDKKLQLQQLQSIEQQWTSRGDAFQSQNNTPLKPNSKKKLLQKSSQIKQQSQVLPSKFNLRKVVLITIISILFFLIAVSLSKNIKKKGKKNSKK